MPSQASRPIWQTHRLAVPFIRVAPTRCRVARPKTPATFNAVRDGRRDVGSRRLRQRWFMTAPVLEVDNVRKYFPVGTGTFLHRKTAWVKAVEGISFAIATAETLGLIGESGCGKTTTAKLILLQESPTEGTIRFDGEDVGALKGPALMRYRRSVQVLFQDPFSSLSPRMRVGSIISEPLEIHTELSHSAMRERVAEVQLGARQNGLRLDSAYADLSVRDAELAAHAEFRKHLYAYDVVPDARAAAADLLQ